MKQWRPRLAEWTIKASSSIETEMTNSPPLSIVCPPHRLLRAKMALKWESGFHPHYLVPSRPCPNTKATAEQLPAATTDEHFTRAKSKPQTPKTPAPADQAEMREIKITSCRLWVYWGSCVSSPRLWVVRLVIGAYNVSFPICFCPLALWLGHNVLWLLIPKHWSIRVKWGTETAWPWERQCVCFDWDMRLKCVSLCFLCWKNTFWNSPHECW